LGERGADELERVAGEDPAVDDGASRLGQGIIGVPCVHAGGDARSK
jgi:hypothetical protein